MPPENNFNNMNAGVPVPHHESEVRLVLPALLLVIILVGGYLWLKSHHPVTSTLTPSSTETTDSDNQGTVPVVEITNSAVTSNGNSVLPTGFPSSIPVESANIKESYKADYTAHGLTQYTVTYISNKSADAVWQIYSEYLNSNGYTVNEANTSEKNGTIIGNKGDDEIDVAITTLDSGSYVQVGYLTK
jgi:hypothetical protein